MIKSILRKYQVSVVITSFALLRALSMPVVAAEVEVKYLVSKDDTAQAIEKLKPLLTDKPLNERVCFFETAECALKEKDIILRAREKADAPDDSTLKLRAKDESSVTGLIANTLEVEQDWTSLTSINFSRSLDNKELEEGLFDKVMKGEKKPKALFKTQKALFEERGSGVDLESLKRYGPLEAKVWKKAFKLPGFDKKITVEIWNLGGGDKQETLVELSAKVEGTTHDDLKAKAKLFFDAVVAAKIGASESKSKTSTVLTWFKPGK